MKRLLFVLCILALAPSAWGTRYFLDYGAAGDDSGTSTANAYTTLAAAIGSAKTGGDTIFVCRTHKETLGADTGPFSDGATDALIVLLKDDGTHWPDSSGTPTITCKQYNIQFITDMWWKFDGLKFYEISEHALYLNVTPPVIIANCEFDSLVAANDYFVYANSSCLVHFDNCTFDGKGTGQGIYVRSGSRLRLRGCSFDDLSYGIQMLNGNVEVDSCSFGNSASNTVDIFGGGAYCGTVKVQGGSFADGNSKIGTGSASYKHGIVNHWFIREYVDGSNRPMLFADLQEVDLLTNYDSTRVGGGAYSLAMTCNLADVLHVTKPRHVLDLIAYADSGESRDYTIYCKRADTWDTAPTASELYLEARYYDGTSWKTAVSTATLDNDATWYALTVSSVEPAKDGGVGIRLYLGDYDSDGTIYIDPTLVATGEEYHEVFHWGLPDLAYSYTGGGQIILVN